MVDAEFKWGKKKGIGGKNKDVTFYESFTYDAVDYNLFDSVYLYRDAEPEPHIGIIVKIWENGDKGKKVKILWFFRPCEILNFLDGYEALENELFLACGEGLGLSNINPLEAIAGKCNVVCISKDIRNQHPSDEDLQNADFVCYRFFDVGQRKILDKIDDKIAGIEVKNIFNNLDSRKVGGLLRLGLDEKEVSVKVTTRNEAVALSSEKNNKLLIEKLDGTVDSKPSFGEKRTSSIGLKEASTSNGGLHSSSRDKALPQAKEKENGVYKASLAKQKSSTKLSHCSRDGLEMIEISKIKGNVSIDKAVLKSKVDVETSGRAITGVPDRPINKRSREGKAYEKEKYGASSAKITSNVQNRRNYEDDDVKEFPSKKPKIDIMSTKLSGDKFHDRQINKILVEGKASEKEKYGVSSANIVNNMQNRRNSDDDAKEVPSKKPKIDTVSTKLSGDKFHDKQINKRLVEGKASEKEKYGVSSANIVNNMQNRRNSDDDAKEVPSKKPKIDTMSTKLSGDKFYDRQIDKRLVEGTTSEKEKYGVSSANIVNNMQNRRNYDDDVKEVPSKKPKIDTVSTKLSGDKLRNESSTTSLNIEHKLDYRLMEVTQRPDVDRSKWFKPMPWEERMKNAYEQGKLVLLENLDPSLTSSEVQDIIWLGFKERCTAKLIQKTAYSSPHSGQAFVIFKRKETAESVIIKLEEGCFMMSNGRPLVGSFGLPCPQEKKSIFYGHHAIDQFRIQTRETKDAVSTSHCSQANNIEYDMAIEWCLLQEREDKTWRRLYKQQGEELSKLKAKLKSKI